MARKKVTIAWIANNAARRATLKKRQAGLLKKASELATLCGVNACVVVYAPEEDKLEVWPSQKEAASLLQHYISIPEIHQNKNALNHESYSRQQIVKLEEKLQKQQRLNYELEAMLLMLKCVAGKGLQGVGIDALKGLAWMAAKKMKLVKSRLQVLNNGCVDPLHFSIKLLPLKIVVFGWLFLNFSY